MAEEIVETEGQWRGRPTVSVSRWEPGTPFGVVTVLGMDAVDEPDDRCGVFVTVRVQVEHHASPDLVRFYDVPLHVWFDLESLQAELVEQPRNITWGRREPS